jgi:hypothetical protein
VLFMLALRHYLDMLIKKLMQLFYDDYEKKRFN